MIVRRRRRKEGVKRWVGRCDCTIRSLQHAKEVHGDEDIRRALIKLLELGTAIGHLPYLYACVSLGV